MTAKQKIFLVEDHPVMRQSFSLLIEATSNLEVCGAVETAEEALEVIGEVGPDVVLVDISLPGMSGIELTAHLHADYPHLPVLITTGHGDEHYRRQALAVGASGFVFKHDGPDALLDAIYELLQTEAG